MRELSRLQRYRLGYLPSLPPSLMDVQFTAAKEITKVASKEQNEEIHSLFPLTSNQPLIRFEKGASLFPPLPLKIGVIFSGGQAPGGHNVISGLFDALKKIHSDSQLIGFVNGFKGLLTNHSLEITEDLLVPYRNQGGFDLIGSDRTKIETLEQFEAAESAFLSHKLDGFVIIGGDDSNTNGAFLSEYCKRKGLSVRIIGVPKTIDGDLKNEWIETSFGFDTACKVYSEMIGNLLSDSLSAKKYYFFVRLMGRSASHITLECVLQTHANFALIGEEAAACNDTLSSIVNKIADLICERSGAGKEYGTILIPEGLLEFIPQCRQMLVELNRLLAENLEMDQEQLFLLLEEQLTPSSVDCFVQFPKEQQKQLLLERDAHGNVQLAKIETERLLIYLVELELKKRQLNGTYSGKFSPVPLYFGYEGRSGMPTNFDCRYCYALGHVAALLVRSNVTGYMACIKELAQPVESWIPLGIPIVAMLHMEVRGNKRKAVIKKALVEIEGPVFAAYQEHREKWKKEDQYISPGPIQFEGPDPMVNSPALTIQLSKRPFNFDC